MIEGYKIEPDGDLYACMVDMLGCSGKFVKSHKFVKSMPMGPQKERLVLSLQHVAHMAMFKIAEIVAEQLFKLECDTTRNYMLLSSIYA